MKKLSILVLCATLAITPAFAEMTAYYNTPSVELSTQSALLSTAYEPTTLPTVPVDLSFAFDDIKNLQAVAMTDKEMMETEGAWSGYTLAGLGAFAGGFGGHYGYISSIPITGKYNAGNHMAAIGFGALGGVASPVMGVGHIAWGLGFGVASGAGTAYLGNRFETIDVH